VVSNLVGRRVSRRVSDGVDGGEKRLGRHLPFPDPAVVCDGEKGGEDGTRGVWRGFGSGEGDKAEREAGGVVQGGGVRGCQDLDADASLGGEGRQEVLDVFHGERLLLPAGERTLIAVSYHIRLLKYTF
jgi:hypothetical protein